MELGKSRCSNPSVSHNYRVFTGNAVFFMPYLWGLYGYTENSKLLFNVFANLFETSSKCVRGHTRRDYVKLLFTSARFMIRDI